MDDNNRREKKQLRFPMWKLSVFLYFVLLSVTYTLSSTWEVVMQIMIYTKSKHSGSIIVKGMKNYPFSNRRRRSSNIFGGRHAWILKDFPFIPPLPSHHPLLRQIDTLSFARASCASGLLRRRRCCLFNLGLIYNANVCSHSPFELSTSDSNISKEKGLFKNMYSRCRISRTTENIYNPVARGISTDTLLATRAISCGSWFKRPHQWPPSRNAFIIFRWCRRRRTPFANPATTNASLVPLLGP